MIQLEIKTEEHFNYIKKNFTFKSVLENFLKSSSQVLCFRLKGDLVGILHFMIVRGEINIYYIIVKPEYRHKKWGFTMLSSLFNMYDPKITFNCSIRESNAASIRLFISKGFIEVGREIYPDGEVKLKMKKHGTQEQS